MLQTPLLAARMILRTTGRRAPLLRLALSVMAHRAIAEHGTSHAPLPALRGTFMPHGHQHISWSAPGMHATLAAPGTEVRGCRALHASRVDSSMPSAGAGCAAQCPDGLDELTSTQRKQVDGFITFLLQQNEKMNLTGGVSTCC